VNGYKPESGLKVRQRLLLYGYTINRAKMEWRYVPKELHTATDETLVQRCILPLHFKKNIS